MRISDVAKQLGIPISTIRYYEKQSVTRKPSRKGRERSYSPKDVRALQFVRAAQSLGLPLREISTLVQKSWDKGEMAKIAAGHRETVRAKIEALHRVDGILSALETCACKSFSGCDLSVSDGKRDD